ncbi:MAG: hypothetical protein ACAF41_25370 [Leptolyngbya sp. BL-A-14]
MYPVLGTLGGATLGFLASSLTTWFNNREIKFRSKDDRTRNRLESIYEILVKIQQDYISLMLKAIAYIHGGEKIAFDKNEEIPSSIKLEMMISLYFPEFKEKMKPLEIAKDLFGKELASLMLGSTENLRLSEKQELAGKFVVLQSKVDKSIIEFQKAIISSIKP